MFKNIVIYTALLALCAGTFFIFRSSSNKEKNGTLILGTMSGWPPYVSINKYAEYQGLDIDIAKKIAKKLNKKLVIKDMDTAMLMTALEQGKVDFIMTGLCITKDRLRKIAMIPYQGEAIKELPLVFWNEIPKGITTIEDIAKIPNAVISVEAGSAQEEIIKQYVGLTIKESNPMDALLDLKYGKTLACLLEPPIFEDYKAKCPNLKALMIPLDEKNQIQGNGIGIKKDNTELIQNIEAIIKKLKDNGFIAACEDTWIGNRK